MKTIAQATSQALSSASKPPSESGAPAANLPTQLPLSADLCDLLWARMVARYGSAWTSKYGDSPEGLAGAEWRDTLSGVSREMLREGFHADVARADDFPPSSTRFRALCFGVPTFPALRYEFSHGEIPRTPFGLLCWQFVDSFALRRADQAEADRIVRDAYELGKAHVLAGGEVPEVHAALAAPTGPEVGKEPWRPLQISDDEHAACAPHVESLRKQFGIGA